MKNKLKESYNIKFTNVNLSVLKDSYKRLNDFIDNIKESKETTSNGVPISSFIFDLHFISGMLKGIINDVNEQNSK